MIAFHLIDLSVQLHMNRYTEIWEHGVLLDSKHLDR